MKVQDDISMPHTRTQTHTRTSRNPICPPLFQSWGHKNSSVNYRFYSREKSLNIAWACFRNATIIVRKGASSKLINIKL